MREIRYFKNKVLCYLILCFIFCMSGISPAYAQREANVWHFGSGRALDFTGGIPISLNSSAMSTFEGSSSVCNSDGNLLMYTNGGGRQPQFSGQDGGHIWNRNNVAMYDMNGVEGGGFSAAQSSVIVKAPGQNTLYYVFTMDELEFSIGSDSVLNAAQPQGRGFSFFTVDMSLNGGLGGVVLADQRVYVPSYEGLCAIRHANQTDYWILINYDTTGIGVYRLTSSGLSLANIFIDSINTYKIIKASPDGQKVQRGNLMLDFNPSTGLLNNPTVLSNDFSYGEFSPNSNFFYQVNSFTGFTYRVERYNIAADSVDAIIFTGLTPGESPGQM